MKADLYFRFRWSHEAALHRMLSRTFYAMMRFVLFAVDLISITTNGAEREILMGLRRTISEGLPYISLARTGSNYEEMMQSVGFTLYAHDDRGFTFERRA